MEAGKMDVERETVAVARLVTDVADTVGSLVSKKGNRLALELAEPLGEMNSDITKLRQCLFNLISNAAKFTEAGVITCAVSRDWQADQLSFSVAVTGMGITPDQVSCLFERFAQADETISKRFGGTGLGLALTKAFCEILGGDISVDSVVGTGTRFTIRIPARLPG